MAITYTQTASWVTVGTDVGTGASSYKEIALTGLAAGDLLVAFGCAENYQKTEGVRLVSTTAGSTSSWTTSSPAVAQNANVDLIAGWATVSSGTTATVRVQMRVDTTLHMGGCVWQIPAAEWNSATNPAFTTVVSDSDGQWDVSLSYTSTLLFTLGDYAAVSLGTSNTPTGATLHNTVQDGSRYSTATRSWTAQGSGTVAYGLSGVSGLTASGIAVAVREVTTTPVTYGRHITIGG